MRFDGTSMSKRVRKLAYTVVGILWLVLVTGLWAYLWVH